RLARLARVVRSAGRETIDVAHDRVRQALLARIDADALRRRHSEIARALRDAGSSDADTLFRHFLAAGEDERAAQYAETAARTAADALAFDRAAELYAAALRLSSTETSRGHSLRV